MNAQELNIQVEKRDRKTLEEFDSVKIFNAVEKGYKQVYGDFSQSFAEEVALLRDSVITDIKNQYIARGVEKIRIDTIQDLVIYHLETINKSVSDAYSSYAAARIVDRIGDANNLHKSVERLIDKDPTEVNENANKDSRAFHTRRDKTAGAVAKYLGTSLLADNIPDVMMAHLEGDLHWHDLDYSPYEPMTNCCLVNVEKMLKEGYLLGNAEIEPPKSIGTAAAQIAQIIAQVASMQYGGTSIDRLDEVLEPYAELTFAKHLDSLDRIEDENLREKMAGDMTEKSIYDAIQSLEYEVNTLFTSNGQTPFVTFGFGLGQSEWAREIQRAILQVRIKGLGKMHRTAIFPKLVFAVKNGLNLKEGDPNYDIKQLALECSAKRMYPDILSYENVVKITGDFKTPMGCRSFLHSWTNPETGLNETAGRMNLGVVTINLPRIAIERKGDFVAFWDQLDQRISQALRGLEFRANRCMEANPDDAPILYKSGAWGKKLESGEKVSQLFQPDRATISLGYIGLYEVATLMFDNPNWETSDAKLQADITGEKLTAREFTLAILQRMKYKCEAFSEKTGVHFGIYGTPSESLTDRFCRMDKERFGSIPNITDKDYYTNSFHYDIRKKPTPWDKLKFEVDYPELASGGFIHYCEYPMMLENIESLEAVWDYAVSIGIGYLGTNTPIDKCYVCGLSGDFEPNETGFACPECGNSNPDLLDVTKRVCGYLGSPQLRPMIHGRHEEIRNRVKHADGEKSRVIREVQDE